MNNSIQFFSYGRYVLNNPIRIKKDRIQAIKKFYNQFDKIENLSKQSSKINGNITTTSRSSRIW